MADGNLIVHGRVIAGWEAAVMTLECGTGAGHVVAHCPTCGHRESVDVAWWRRSKFDRELPLSALSNRLRCLCGGRQVDLEVWPISPAIHDETPRTFHWRA